MQPYDAIDASSERLSREYLFFSSSLRNQILLTFKEDQTITAPTALMDLLRRSLKAAGEQYLDDISNVIENDSAIVTRRAADEVGITDLERSNVHERVHTLYTEMYELMRDQATKDIRSVISDFNHLLFAHSMKSSPIDASFNLANSAPFIAQKKFIFTDRRGRKTNSSMYIKRLATSTYFNIHNDSVILLGNENGVDTFKLQYEDEEHRNNRKNFNISEYEQVKMEALHFGSRGIIVVDNK